jgi:hypothetical protein
VCQGGVDFERSRLLRSGLMSPRRMSSRTTGGGGVGDSPAPFADSSGRSPRSAARHSHVVSLARQAREG